MVNVGKMGEKSLLVSILKLSFICLPSYTFTLSFEAVSFVLCKYDVQ